LRPNPDAAFRKKANRPADRQAGERFTYRTSIRTVPPHRKGTESVHQRSAESGSEQLFHCHPIHITRIPSANDGGIEMADMIASHDQSSTRTKFAKSCKMNTADRKQQNPYQVPANVAEKTLRNLRIHSEKFLGKTASSPIATPNAILGPSFFLVHLNMRKEWESLYKGLHR
jgi:hypothetical protein